MLHTLFVVSVLTIAGGAAALGVCFVIVERDVAALFARGELELVPDEDF